MKKKSLLSMVIFLFIFFSTMPWPCQGAPPPAVYSGRLFPDGNPPSTIYVTTYGTYSASWSFNKWFAINNLFLSPGFPPRVTASSQVYVDNGLVTPITGGNIKYFTRVSKKDPQVPDTTKVPLQIGIKAIVSMFYADGTIPPDGAESIIYFNNEKLVDIFVTHYEPEVTEKSVNVTMSRSVPVETDIPIIIIAGGGWNAGPFNTNGGIFALADPTVVIDPTFMVTVNGKQVPANQVLKLEFSPGFNPGSADAALQLLLLD